jgi:hypothetical protein
VSTYFKCMKRVRVLTDVAGTAYSGGREGKLRTGVKTVLPPSTLEERISSGTFPLHLHAWAMVQGKSATCGPADCSPLGQI